MTAGVETTGGTIHFTDADAVDGHTISVAQNSNIGTFSATLGTDSTDGSPGTVNWTFSATDAQITALAAAQQTVTETYTVVIDDLHGGETTQNVTIKLTNPDHAPTVVADSAAVNENATVAATTRATGVLGNDSDVDGDTLAVTSILAGTSGTASAVVAGTATVVHGVYGDLTINADGTYTYTPNNANAEALTHGQAVTDTFTYTASDGHNGNSSTTLTFDITGVGINQPPVAHAPAHIEIAENGAFTFSGGNALSVTDVDGGTGNETAEVSWSHGTVTAPIVGTLTGTELSIGGPLSFINEILQGLEFTPDAGFTGQTGLTVSIDDNGNTGAGGAMSDSKTVTIDVAPSVGNTAVTNEDTPLIC